jgi:hypothetical protein
MKNTVFLVIFPLLVMSQLHAQQEKPVPAPKTKLEAFEAQSGAVIIRGFSRIGYLRGVYGGTVTVESKEFLNLALANVNSASLYK